MNALLLAALLYVSNERAGSVQVIDTSTDRIIATAKLGNRPRGMFPTGQRVWGIAISLDGRKVYTANSLSNTVSVIDTATRRVFAPSRWRMGRGHWRWDLRHEVRTQPRAS